MSPKYVLTLAIAAGLILLLGTMFRPRLPAAQEAQPSETDIAGLNRLAEKRSLESRTKLFQEIADDVAPSIVGIAETGMSGIVWENRVVVAARSEREPFKAVSVSTADANAHASDVIWSPRFSAAAIHLPAGGAELVPAKRSESLAASSDWVVAVWRSGQRLMFAPAQFVESDNVVCNGASSVEVQSTLTWTPRMVGGGVFSMGGNLLGVILPCGGRYAAIVPGSVDEMLRHSGSIEGRLLARFGLSSGTLSDAEMKYFKRSSGVIVREVWEGQPAAIAGLMPGDILVEMDKDEVTDSEIFQKQLASSGSSPKALLVRRGGRNTRLLLSELEAKIPESGVLWEVPKKGYRIDSVIPGSRASAAGILSGDYVLRVEFAEPFSLAQLQRLLAPGYSSAVFVELQRGNRRWGTLLTPAGY